MGYRVHGRIDTETISVMAKDAKDAARQASELAKRGIPHEDPEHNPKIGIWSRLGAAKPPPDASPGTPFGCEALRTTGDRR